jgi:hypothetical protein
MKDIYLILFLATSFSCFAILLMHFTLISIQEDIYEIKYSPWKDRSLYGAAVFGAIWVFCGLKLFEIF